MMARTGSAAACRQAIEVASVSARGDACKPRKPSLRGADVITADFIGSAERKGHDARTYHPRAGREAELHEGRAGTRRTGRNWSRRADGAHGAALRRAHVRGVLRPAGAATAGREPGRGVGQPCPADRRDHDRDGAGVHRELPRAGRGLRGRQLDAGRGAGRGQAGGAAGARGGGAAQLRRHDAGGDQPAADRPAVRAAVRDLAGGDRVPGSRGPPGERGAPGRQPDDRHAAGPPGPVRRGRGPGRRRAAGTVRGGHLAPALQRRRPGFRRGPGAGAARGGRRDRPDHPGAPAGPGRAAGRGPGRAPPAARLRPARLPGVHGPGQGRLRGRHRLRRGAGGDHAAAGAVPDPAAEHRTAHHDHQRQQPAGHRRRAGRRGAQGVPRRALRGRAAAAVGRARRTADRPDHHRLAGPGGPLMTEIPEDEAVPEAPGDPGLAAERDRLAQTLRDTRLQLAMTQARLSALEGSATLTLGRTLVRAARRPWSRGVQLPLDLIRMWRERGGLTGPAAATLALASAQLNDVSGVGERFLSALTAPGLGAPSAGFSPPGLVVTGVLSAESCATLATDAVIYPLLPHDADVMLESVGADMVLIEAAAMLASSPWAYAGDPAATDRGRRLGRLIAGARALGKPVIFIRNVPAHLAPGLDWVAASCDVVSDDGFGVQLARFNPIGLSGQRPNDPVYAGPRDPREPPAVRALLDSLTGVAGPATVTGEIAWRRRPALYREHALFLTASPGQAHEQRACGARVIMVNGEPAALREQIAETRGQAPLTETETLPGLHEIFTAHATPARLAGLADVAGLPGHLVTGRQIAVLARVRDAADATRSEEHTSE